MAIYDHQGASQILIGRVTDWNGSVESAQQRVYDYNGSASSLIHEDSISIADIPIGARLYLPRKDGGGNDGWNHFMMADHDGIRHTVVAWQPIWPDMHISINTGLWYEGGNYGGDGLSQACLKVHQRLNDTFMYHVFNDSHPWIRNVDGTGNYVINPPGAKVWPLGWVNATGDTQGQSIATRRLQYFASHGWDGFHAGVNERVFSRDWHLQSAGYQIIIANNGNATQMTGGYCRPCLTVDSGVKFILSGDAYIFSSF